MRVALLMRFSSSLEKPKVDHLGIVLAALGIISASATATPAKEIPSANLQRLNQQIQRYPTCPSVYSERGDAYFLVGDYKSAEKDYSQAIGLSKSSPDPWFGGTLFARRAIARKTSNNIAAAKDDFNHVVASCNRLIDKKDNVRNALALRGALKYQFGHMKEAINDFTLALRTPEAFEERENDVAKLDYDAMKYRRQGQYEKTDKVYESIVKLNTALYGEESPEVAWVLFLLAQNYGKHDDCDSANKISLQVLDTFQNLHASQNDTGEIKNLSPGLS